MKEEKLIASAHTITTANRPAPKFLSSWSRSPRMTSANRSPTAATWLMIRKKVKIADASGKL